MPLSSGQMSIIDRLFGPQEDKPPKTNYITAVLNDASSRTNINQIRGINKAGASGSGIPKHVTNVTAVVSNASAGSTSQIVITFRRDSTDTAFAGVTVYAKGYQGNQSPTQVGYGTDAPLTIILNNTGESVSLIVQATGNGGSAPIATAPSCGVRLPQNATGGFGTQTTTNVTATQVKQIAGGGSSVGTGVLTASSVLQASPLTVNLSTEGSYDWMLLTGYAGGAVAPNVESATAFKNHWKAGNGRLLSAFRLLQNAQLAAGTDTSQFTWNSTSGDDAAFNETVNPAKQPMVSRAGDPFWFGNNNSLFFYPFGFQWRDIPLSTLTPRTLKFYVYVNNATVTLTARLSDGSAADASTVMTTSSTSEYIVTVHVTPGSFGAMLNVSLMLTSFNTSASRVGISAVTMA
jgi:hypothetical protein